MDDFWDEHTEPEGLVDNLGDELDFWTFWTEVDQACDLAFLNVVSFSQQRRLKAQGRIK